MTFDWNGQEQRKEYLINFYPGIENHSLNTIDVLLFLHKILDKYEHENIREHLESEQTVVMMELIHKFISIFKLKSLLTNENYFLKTKNNTKVLEKTAVK